MYLLLVAMVASWFLPRYNQIYFILKNTITFVFFGLSVVKFILYAFRESIRKNKGINDSRKVSILRGFLIVTIVLALVCVMAAQRRIIEIRTPVLTHCTYYDDYGNLVTNSPYYSTCIEPEVTNLNDTTKKFTFQYDVPGMNEGVYHQLTKRNELTDRSLDNYYVRADEGYLYEEITITYNDSDLIEEYNLKLELNYILKKYTKQTLDNGEKKYTFVESEKMSNYLEFKSKYTFSDSEITQRKTTYEKRLVLNRFDNLTDRSSYEFQETDLIFDLETTLIYNIPFIGDEYLDEVKYLDFELFTQSHTDEDSEEPELSYRGYLDRSALTTLAVYSITSKYDYDTSESELARSKYTLEFDSSNNKVKYDYSFMNNGASVREYALNSTTSLYLISDSYRRSIHDYHRNRVKIMEHSDIVQIDDNRSDKLLRRKSYGFCLEYYSINKDNYEDYYSLDYIHFYWHHDFTHYDAYSYDFFSMKKLLVSDGDITFKLGSMFEYLLRLVQT